MLEYFDETLVLSDSMVAIFLSRKSDGRSIPVRDSRSTEIERAVRVERSLIVARNSVSATRILVRELVCRRTSVIVVCISFSSSTTLV